ncbi:hypothetical protein B5V01_08185 [Mesorhizobium erdmanii]|uniref:Uncharacterized protein n=3 Tax=Phyllobacteriaceae TaxID=69277 RepID=A0A3M9X2X5_9HYPH|nr:hypothetical protein DNR46_28740 [Mesorhizobium japonicum]RXT47931.1 hypothetical protein B5V01_08185 [Mesorhizobium erdmanii]
MWVLIVWFTLVLATSAMAGMPAKRDVGEMFKAAETAGKVGIARKTRAIDARAAHPGEIIVTLIAGEGKETQSRPAEAGDMVVRNRCPETGNEQYLVSGKKFVARYQGPYGKPDAEGWSEYRPTAPEMHYFIVDEAEGDFVFTAPWGEDMVAKPGDAIVGNPKDPADIYRVAAKSFKCTYEVLKYVP